MEQAKICLKKLEAWGRSCPIFGPPPPTNTASQSENSDTTPSQPSDENRLSADDSNPPAAGTMPYNNDDSAPFVANGNTDTDLLGKTSSFPSHDKRAESDYCGAQQSGKFSNKMLKWLRQPTVCNNPSLVNNSNKYGVV
jgi:hypothetical protein